MTRVVEAVTTPTVLTELQSRWLPRLAPVRVRLLAVLEAGSEAVTHRVRVLRARRRELLGVSLLSLVGLLSGLGGHWGFCFFGLLLGVSEVRGFRVQRQLILLRPIRTTAIGCQRALVAVDASDLARRWRDEVVRQGRTLSRLDGEMCEALAGADGERVLEQEDHAQRWRRLHGRPDSESA